MQGGPFLSSLPVPDPSLALLFGIPKKKHSEVSVPERFYLKFWNGIPEGCGLWGNCNRSELRCERLCPELF